MIAAAMLAAQLALAPCTIEEVTGEAQCGTYEVWEDRAAGSGRRVPLNVVVLRATGTLRQPDPLFVLQGGPGQGVTQLADFYGRVFAQVRASRDLVLVDLRGTGQSAPLLCPELGAPAADGVLSPDLLDPDAVKACRARLSTVANLTKYTTELAVADLDEVRAAMGYERVNLYGTSYGTRAALVYAREFPDRVRTISMKGVVPPSLAMPSTHAADAETAWRAFLARCKADEACGRDFPSLEHDFEAILKRFEIPSVLDSVQGGTTRRVTVTRPLLGEALRNMFYTPESLARLPGVIRSMASGRDDARIADIVARTRLALSGGELSAGFFLSVTCTEDIPYLPAAADSTSAATYGGTYRLDQQRRACEAWPRGQVPSRRRAAATIEAPLLMFSGEFDPVTPPANGEEVLRSAPRGRHVVVKHNGHPFGRLEGCGNTLIASFIDAASARDLDVSCASRIQSVPFARP